MLSPESSFTQSYPDCPMPELWSARDHNSSEVEVGEFLYGLIRLLKPNVIVETGCYRGDTTVKLVDAVEANGLGAVFACDTDEQNCIMTEATTRAIVTNESGESLIRSLESINLAFLDSGNGEDRLRELTLLKPGTVVVLHDARWPEIESLEGLFIPSPRGLKILRKEARNV